MAIAALAAEAEARKQQGTGSGQVDGVLMKIPFTIVRNMLRVVSTKAAISVFGRLFVESLE